MSLLSDIQKQPRYIREIMFALCAIISISLVGIIWFRSFEKNLFVLMNPDPAKQERFFAERDQRTPLVYANITKSLGSLRAAMYDAFGFFGDYNSNQVKIGEDLKGETHQLPLSGDR